MERKKKFFWCWKNLSTKSNVVIALSYVYVAHVETTMFIVNFTLPIFFYSLSKFYRKSHVVSENSEKRLLLNFPARKCEWNIVAWFEKFCAHRIVLRSRRRDEHRICTSSFVSRLSSFIISDLASQGRAKTAKMCNIITKSRFRKNAQKVLKLCSTSTILSQYILCAYD